MKIFLYYIEKIIFTTINKIISFHKFYFLNKYIFFSKYYKFNDRNKNIY